MLYAQGRVFHSYKNVINQDSKFKNLNIVSLIGGLIAIR